MRATFCGHSDTIDNGNIKPWLIDTLKNLIHEGYDEFYIGAYGNFDSMSAQAVNELKKDFPYIKCIFVTPYLNKEYNKLLYSECIYPPLEKIPKRLAIIKRNEWMVNNRDAVISYVVRPFGGANKTLIFAEQKNKRIISYVE